MVLTKLILSTFHDPIVSTDIGTKRWVYWSAEYFVFLFDAALSAAAPAIVDVASTCDAAIVSGTVPSHVKHFPFDQGMSVTPSGRFSSLLVKPSGSFDAGILARHRLRHIMSFSWLCLVWRPALRRQNKPCRPRASTSAPHGHVCGSHSHVPSRVLTARRMVSLDILKPMAVIGDIIDDDDDDMVVIWWWYYYYYYYYYYHHHHHHHHYYTSVGDVACQSTSVDESQLLTDHGGQ